MSTAKPPPPGFAPVARRGRFTAEIAELYQHDGPDGFVRGVRVEERHLNAAGIAHGGFLATMMDTTFGQAVRDGGRLGFTVRMVTDFVSPAKRGDWLEGRARVVRATATLAFLEGELTIGQRVVISGKAVFRLHDPRQAARFEKKSPEAERRGPVEGS